uniref:O-acyltransferase WSD1 C-terminal domain-containing protein n=1 Tax=Euplotes harpa TaxID=151035 RepID=A0A7S3JG98_9SPIT|mmetsp:Transcript_39193/g.44877  ORF Transcript_39193/g.44877 Transcript_39193/m.44877 type:complete len:307 (+) Transcript_39193:477-1397(+)
MEGKSVILIKFHHSFTDGGGMLNALTFLNDVKHKPKDLYASREIPFYMRLVTLLLSPYLLVLSLLQLYIKRWEGSDKIQTADGANSGESTIHKSKVYNLNHLKACYKKYEGVTLNNYMMGIVSKSIHEWYVLNNVAEPKEIIATVPVVMKPFSPTIEKVDIDNCTAGITFSFKLKAELEEAIRVNKTEFERFFNLPFLIHVITSLKLFMYLPTALGALLYHMCCKNIDLTLSNVSCSKEAMYLLDKKIARLYGFLGVFCNCNLIVVLTSYNYELSFQITADKKIQMDPAQLLGLIQANLDSQIQVI